MENKDFKPKTSKGTFMTEYLFFRGCGNNHKTALYNARLSMSLGD